MSVRVVTLPVFRHYWLWVAEPGAGAGRAAAASAKVLDWREGVGLDEKVDLMGKILVQRVSRLQRAGYRARPLACPARTAAPEGRAGRPAGARTTAPASTAPTTPPVRSCPMS